MSILEAHARTNAIRMLLGLSPIVLTVRRRRRLPSGSVRVDELAVGG